MQYSYEDLAASRILLGADGSNCTVGDPAKRLVSWLAGGRALVTDATSTTFAAAGSNKVSVYTDGTSWSIG